MATYIIIRYRNSEVKCLSAEFRDFDPASASVQEYDDQAYQDIYYVASTFEDAMEKFRLITTPTHVCQVTCIAI